MMQPSAVSNVMKYTAAPRQSHTQTANNNSTQQQQSMNIRQNKPFWYRLNSVALFQHASSPE